ncbi:uncharacterized protein LOC125872443 [Solanum stenotomum]|uniref:uncharacterized protein LOC125872443 n=1 Tax=Solanum stenotomum TaxID=172797 RepID=UPI0020D098EA|nr:uncharacterized protein LOC125872443 [Solanum stenotomum]
MENPFYGSYWSQPAHPRFSSNMRGIPVQSIHQKPAGIKPASKVVQIPVHFVSSDPERSVLASAKQKPEADRSASALKIQKVFRGFLVRKSVKKIMSIRKEVEDVERKLLCRETAELICRDERERLRVNETLMSLLFKLDSIRGVDSGVRECRKAVIRKAIYLQEKVDSIVSAANQIAAEEENQYNDYDELSEPANQTVDIPNSTGNQEEDGKLTNQNELCDLLEQSEDVETQAASNDEKTPVEGEHDVAPSVEKCKGLQEVKEETDCPMHECVEESVERGEVGDVTEGVEDEKNETRSHKLYGEEESRRNRELMEKMVEKNENMMRMMTELCQKNEIQTRMLNSLAQRVDQLEKTFLCDRLKTKKKKRHPA